MSIELPNYVRVNDGRYCKYNYEFNNKYYCTNNMIVDNYRYMYYPKEQYILFDYFILDLVNKKISQYDSSIEFKGFEQSIGEIETIDINNDKKNGIKTVTINKNIKIILNRENQLIGYVNNEINKISSHFLFYNKYMENISLGNVETIGMCFLDRNKCLKSINIPNAKILKAGFLHNNQELEELDIPLVETIGASCLVNNDKLKKINAHSVKSIGFEFLNNNNSIEEIDCPNLEHVDSGVLQNNTNIKKVNFDSLDDSEKEKLPEVLRDLLKKQDKRVSK